MSDDSISKKVLLDVQLAGDDVEAKMSGLATAINGVAASVKQLQTATKTSQTNLNEYTEKLAQSKLTAQQNREEITRLNLVRRQEKDAIDKAKGAIVAAKGSYDEAQKSLTALGRAIKSAEGGFRSTDPVIQAQIAKYKQLNKELGEFDKKLGNHQRNVGNYEGALEKVSSQLDRLLPGFGQLQGILKGAVQGFSALGKGAAEAGEAGVGAEVAIEGAAVAAGAAIAAVAAAIVAEGSYLLQFQKYADGLSKTWEGLKAGAMSAMNSINGVGRETGKTKGAAVDMGISFALAFSQAYTAQGEILKTNREIQVDAVTTQIENDKIRKDMLVIMNLKSDELTFQNAYNEAHALTVKQYDREKEAQDKLHKGLIDRATAAYKIDKDDLKALYDIKGGYEAILKVTQKLVNNSDINASFLNEMVESAKKGVEIEGHYKTVEQLEKNKADRKQARLDKEHAKELSLAEKEAQELAKIKQETEQAESERLASITRMLDFQREAFGKELSDADEHYRQLIFKQQQFIERQEVLVNSKKSTPKVKAAAQKAIGAGRNTITQLQKERYADIEKITVEHNRQMIEIAAKGALDLKAVQIAGLNNLQEKELETIENNFDQKMLLLEKNDATYQDTLRKLAKEIADTEAVVDNPKTSKKDKGIAENQLFALKAELNEQRVLLGQNADLVIAYEKQKTKAIDQTNKKYADQKRLQQDDINLLKSTKSAENAGPFGKADKNLESDEIQKVKDEKTQELNQEGLTEKQRQLIIEQSEKKIDDIKKRHQQARKEMALDAFGQIENAAFSIIQQSLARQAQATQVSLNKQRDHDLQNTALTSTQKYAISEKYRIKEGQAKVKQFKQEKELAIVKGIIDTASAVIKAAPNPFLMALAGITGALEIGVIAAQKPPAFAQGGTFKSDGKGAVLPGYSKADNVNATLRSGEAVVVSEAMRDPWAKSVVSAINQAYGGRSFDSTLPVTWTKPGFAAGGVFNNYLPTGDNGLRPQINVSAGRMHPDDIGNIVGGLSSAISRMPAPVVDVKDVNRQQGLLAQATDRLTY